MHNYLVFVYDTYYPAGGWNDLVGSYETLEEAIEQAARDAGSGDWKNYHIVDLQQQRVVARWTRYTSKNPRKPELL